ncbi:MAG: DUF4242 domain-containing protein [Ilumatobacter sp.]|nr:DUF4242 domain-containing protein [Ilumatobacter sp.]
MPTFMVERIYADQLLDTSDEASLRHAEVCEMNDITWLTSFLSADRKKTYCLYEVDDVELLRKHAAELGLPVDAIVEVDQVS